MGVSCVQGGELKPGEMPLSWRSAGGVYKLPYTHPLCENSLAMVVAVRMGPVLVMNGEFTRSLFGTLYYNIYILSNLFLLHPATLKVNQTVDTVRKLSLDPSSYVTEAWPGQSPDWLMKQWTNVCSDDHNRVSLLSQEKVQPWLSKI